MSEDYSIELALIKALIPGEWEPIRFGIPMLGFHLGYTGRPTIWKFWLLTPAHRGGWLLDARLGFDSSRWLREFRGESFDELMAVIRDPEFRKRHGLPEIEP